MTGDLRAALREYLLHDIIKDPGYPLEDAEALISSGLIDSFSLVDLALWVEDRTGFRIQDSQLNAGSFDSLDELLAFIDSNA